jgi:hypothetical protein
MTTINFVTKDLLIKSDVEYEITNRKFDDTIHINE